ncbi:MAG: arginase [Chloroflexi bacterium]|nr:arginase [Chloroflexota bacterium]
MADPKHLTISQFILTPYYLDKPMRGLTAVSTPSWQHNTPTLSNNDVQQRMIELYRPLADQVATSINNGKRPVSIAGDCCTTLGVLAGLQQAGVQPTLLWLDAHGDFNTWETTPGGFLGGMPLAMLVGRGEQTMMQGVGVTILPEERVILSDARNLDPGEAVALSSSAVWHVPNVADLLTSPLPDGPLYVHFDTDILDAADAPAMNYSEPGGPTVDVLRQLFQQLAESEQMIAVSLSTWNPSLDEDGRSEKLIMSLLDTLLNHDLAQE